MSDPLTIKISANVIVTKPDGSRSINLYTGSDFIGFVDSQASNEQNQSNFVIPKNTSVNVPIPPSSVNAKFLLYRFDNPVNLTGLVTAGPTRFGIIEITSANPLAVEAGDTDTSGFVMILGA